jgi:predicted nuclease of restriction endonuclease-like (RecB) superfamily
MTELVKKETDLTMEDYAAFLEDIKARVLQAQTKAALSVNRELVLLYWQIGREILERQKAQGWGAKVIDNLAKDLRAAFPEMKGFSPRNLKYMRSFAESYPDAGIVQEVLAQITWYHNIALLDKLKDAAEREWYAQQTIEHGWSRNILALQIQSNLYQRQGKALTNFERTLPAPQSELAQNIIKDPYNFDFLSLGAEALERDVENGLLAYLKDFFIELGTGFSFVGNQYHLEVGGQDYFIDLLFYHLKLRSFIVIELKIDEFKPEYAGKMSFYLAAVDDLLRHPSDAPSIGLILCRDNNRIIVEYALRDQNKPMCITEYRFTVNLPHKLKDNLPSIERLTDECNSRSFFGLNAMMEKKEITEDE